MYEECLKSSDGEIIFEESGYWSYMTLLNIVTHYFDVLILESFIFFINKNQHNTSNFIVLYDTIKYKDTDTGADPEGVVDRPPERNNIEKYYDILNYSV